MSRKNKIKESKEIIYTLAKSAKDKINENKLLIEEIDSLKNSLHLIKEIFIKCSSLNSNGISKKNVIFDGINNIHNSLKLSNEKLYKENKKFSNKLDSYLNDIFCEKDSLRQQLKIKKIDNFILLSKLKEKDYEISNLTKLIEDFIIAKLFPVDKFDKKIGDNTGYYYLYKTKEQLSNELMNELLYFNLNYKQCIKQNTKKKKLEDKINYYNEIILNIKKFNLKGKTFDEDYNYEKNIQNKDIKFKLSGSQKIPKKISKIDILTVSQLFDVNNDEGKSEAIIDDELHSDDEVTFQPKVKHNNKITKGFRLTQIKEKIPKIDLSLIEFNKKKIMNEADLYSFKRRKFETQNIDEQIKEMALRRKEILHKCKTNIKKIIAMRKFSEDMQKNYNLLKPLKLKTSVFVGINDNNDLKIDDKEGLKEIEEINEVESEEDNYNIMKENINYTQRELKKKKLKKLSVKNLNRNNIINIGKHHHENTLKINKKVEKKRIKIKRAKSK